MDLKYGDNSINFEISAKNVLGVLAINRTSVQPLDILLKDSIMSPIGRTRLENLLRKNKPGDVVILVSDITRSIANYSRILKFLVGEIVNAGVDEKNIEFVVALGTHRQHSEQENKFLYNDLTINFRFTQHDCHNNLISVGTTSTGLEVAVSKRVTEADFVIATGKIDFHYLAGYSGGRKSIMPGISSYDTIRNNHCKLKRDGVTIGEIENNIIAQEMNEACRLVKVDYLLNVVETPYKETDSIFCGHPEFAFDEGVKYFRSIRVLKIPERADCVIISAGGYPKDNDFFNSHKSLNRAVSAVKPNGSIILIGQCREGFGSEKFLGYMLEHNLDDLLNYREEKIQVGGHRAFATAKILKDHRVYVLSALDQHMLDQMNFTPISTAREAINIVKRECGEEFKTYFIPDGKSILPIYDKNGCSQK